MLRAGSLIYAIGISLVLAITSTSLILLAFNTSNVIDNNFVAEKLISNIRSGLNYYLTNSDMLINSNKVSIDLFKNGSDSVDIQKKNWGLFQIITCIAKQNNNTAQATFLTGQQRKRDSIALYISDQNKPLSICGNTIIKGNAYIPLAGIKRAYIEGQNFTGLKLIEGITQVSNSTLPEFDNSLITDYDAFCSNRNTDSIIDILFLKNNKSITNSFNDRTLLIYSAQNIVLDNYHFTGNIIIRSANNIEVNSTCNLTDVLIEAKSIKIDAGFTGTIQAFASDSITVGNRATLLYPSNLCILSTKHLAKEAKILLQNGVNVKGGIINFNLTNILNKSANIEIEDNCKIIGQIYSKGYVSHKGSLMGSIYCSGFILKTSSATYENHLLNCTINDADMPDYYVGIYPTFETKRSALIKRLQ